MITIPVTYSWRVCAPQVFRYLDSAFVEQFFRDGSLRLSCFSQFARHADEQRLDAREGETLFVHRTQQRGGQTLAARAFHGRNAFVLCGSMIHREALMQQFNCDSYIRINDPTQFGLAVASQLPGFVGGAEGPCLYQDNKIIERDLGYIDVTQFGNPEAHATDRDRMQRFINDQMEHYPFFLKDKTYAHPVEYRLVWITSAHVDGFIDIKVPEAVLACSRPNAVTE
jgi:hypothetical protein